VSAHPAPDGFCHPESVGDVRDVILEARRRGARVRVRGAGHSVSPSILTAPEDRQDADAVHVMLDRLAHVTITPDADGRHALVEAGAGCHLGYDPYDPTGRSTWQNSLSVQLDDAGFALSALAGISHQTMAGFLLTGSAGASLRHTLEADVVRIEFVDGNGELHDVTRDGADSERSLFDAVGVSYGLLGIVTRIWLRVGRRYAIAGHELTTSTHACGVDLFGNGTAGRPSLAAALRQNDYCRMFWFPQHGVDRVQVWSARRTDPDESPALAPLEYLSPLASVSGSLLEVLVGNIGDLRQVPARIAAMDLECHLQRALAGDTDRLGLTRPCDCDAPRLAATRLGRRLLARAGATAMGAVLKWGIATRVSAAAGRRLGRRLSRHVHHLIRPFVPPGQKTFRDTWHFGLPIGNQLDDRLWPCAFSEVWLPIEQSAEAMRRLRDYYRAGGDEAASFQRARAFPVEIYAGAASRFWLSPGYQRPSVRVALVWMRQWPGDPQRELFDPVFSLLEDLGARPHWGKYLPLPSAVRQAHYRSQFARLEDFLQLRRALDPTDLFLTRYWRDQLAIRPQRHLPDRVASNLTRTDERADSPRHPPPDAASVRGAVRTAEVARSRP
jgi:hypothetical protein